MPSGQPAPDARLGEVFGDYELTSVIGGGGMGCVYEARRVQGEGPSTVAIKVLSPAFSNDDDFVERFRREADALIRLRHPHLIEVYEKGEHSGPQGETSYFFVMERFAGEDLRRYAQRQALAPATVLAIVHQAAEGLAFAHQNGVVHRDIKPGNILVHGDPTVDGKVKVVDFGVAQLASPTQTLTSLTRSDLILGTLNYMSPEQRLDASRIDQRADVYALAVVAYELLTGSLPLGAFEAPSELRPGLSKATDRALMMALRRDPEQRPSTVAQFSRTLELALRPARARRGAWLGAAALVLAAGGAWFVVPRGPATSGKAVVATKSVSKAVVVPKVVEPAKEATSEQAAELTSDEAVPAWVPGPDYDRLAAVMQKDAEYVVRRARERLVSKPKLQSKKSKVRLKKADLPKAE